jgi:hypothetical protein
MKQIFLIINAAFILLYSGYFQYAHAGSNKLSCALKSEQQFLGALPEFSHNNTPLLGYQCQLIPHYSGFLGNWFPTSPHLYISQSNRLLSTNNSADNATDDDISTAWKVAFSIKRLGQSQLSIFAEQKDWQYVLQAKEDIEFTPSNANGPNDAITIKKGQQARINRTEETFGFSFIFPFQDEKVLTELRLQKSVINQPIQANMAPFEKRSLFAAKTETHEIMIISQSFHRGLNINWQFGIGQGKVILEPKERIIFEAELGQVISLRGQLAFHYQYRINRRWFGHLGWQGNLHYWQQSANDDDFQLGSANSLEQQIFMGIGFTF